MSELDEIANELEHLGRKIDVLDTTVVVGWQELTSHLQLLTDEVRELQKVVGLVAKPDEDLLNKYAMLRKAYTEYEFIKRMVIGNDN